MGGFSAVEILLLASPKEQPWLWVIGVLSLVLAVISLLWQCFTWWQDRRPKILIQQVGSSITDVVRRFDNVGTVYTVDVAIVNQSPRTPVVVCGLFLELPWEDNMFNLLRDPGPNKTYDIGRYVEPYSRHSVLNHRVYEEGKLEVGGVMRGTVLGRSATPVPACFSQKSFPDFKLVVWDQYNHRHSAKIELRLIHGKGPWSLYASPSR